MRKVRPVNHPTPGRPPVEQPPSKAHGGRPAPTAADPADEVVALAALLAEVVHLAGQRAVYPGRWEHLAELALEHHSVRAALATEPTS